jgi:hypothetical protein
MGALLAVFSVSPASSETSFEKVARFMERTIERYGNMEASLTEALGAPSERSVTKHTSPHDPNYTYELVSMDFGPKGAQAVVYRDSDKELLVNLVATTPKLVFGKNVRVGSPKSAVIRELGAPAEERDNEMRYEDESGYVDIVFRLDLGGTVRRMSFSVWMD